MTYPVLYVIVNTTLPSMGLGKSQAHSGHAASAFLYKNVIQRLQKNKEVKETVQKWMDETPQGFGTQINLQVSDWNDAIRIVDEAESRGVISSKVYDPEYPYIVDGETVELISKLLHVKDPVCLNPEEDKLNQKWLCLRPEMTAVYVFGLKNEIEDLMVGHTKKLSLHP